MTAKNQAADRVAVKEIRRAVPSIDCDQDAISWALTFGRIGVSCVDTDEHGAFILLRTPGQPPGALRVSLAEWEGDNENG